MIRQLQYKYANSMIGKKKKSTQLIYFIFAGLILWFGIGMIFAKPEIEEIQVPQKIKVKVENLISKNIVADILIYGHTEASEKVNLKIRTSGVVEKINKKKGQYVKKGDVILTLKMEDRMAQLSAAKASKDKSEIEYNTAKSLLAQDLISRVDFASEEAKYKTATATLDKAILDIQHIALRAPFNGVINELSIEEGSYVVSGENVGVFLNLNPIKINAEIPEKYISRVRKGVVAQVHLSNDISVDALLTYVGSIANSSTRTFAVELEANNKDNKIMEGLTAEIKLPLDTVSAVKIGASSSLTFGEDGSVGVKTIDENNIVHFYPVDIIKEENGGLWVSGLPKSPNVITAGGEFVKVGEEVIPYFKEEEKIQPLTQTETK